MSSGLRDPRAKGRFVRPGSRRGSRGSAARYVFGENRENRLLADRVTGSVDGRLKLSLFLIREDGGFEEGCFFSLFYNPSSGTRLGVYF